MIDDGKINGYLHAIKEIFDRNIMEKWVVGQPTGTDTD